MIPRWLRVWRVDKISVKTPVGQIGLTRGKDRTPALSAIYDLIRRKRAANDVLIVSAQNLDTLIRVDRIDSDHESEMLEAPIDSPGGSGANTACTLATLGNRVSVSGIVGADANGQFLRDALELFEIDLKHLITSKGDEPTGRAIIMVEKGGKRFIVVRPGVNKDFSKEASAADILLSARTSKILHLSSFTDTASLEMQTRLAAEACKSTVVSLTPGALYAGRGLDGLADLLGSVHILFLYREQLETLMEKSSAAKTKDWATKDLLRSYFLWRGEQGFARPHTVLVKEKAHGKGAVMTDQFLLAGAGVQELREIAGPSLDGDARVIIDDTTGAGDAAAAGFLSALLRGENLQGCVNAAFRSSANACTELGARTAILKALPNSGDFLSVEKPIQLR